LNDHELTHERCSELLADFAVGGLDAAATARVETHLRTCPECSDELRAVMALRAGEEPLTELERGRLRRGVAATLGDVIAPAKAPSQAGARWAAALGAAAVLAVVGVAIVSLGSGGDDADSGTAASQEAGSQLRKRDDAGAGGDAGVAADQAAAPMPRPSYDEDAGKLSREKLSKLGKRGATLRAFTTFSATDANELKDEYVKDLADQAGAPVDGLILNCSEKVYEAQPYAALPAFAVRGTLEGREALVLGFAWTEQSSGRLDQFMLWTWPESSCERPIDYRAGKIAPRP
jgi:hypothetical protein